MSHVFDLFCKNHPERLIDPMGRPDWLCRECYINAWNAGARQADAHWADNPQQRAENEKSVDGRLILPQRKLEKDNE